MGLYLDPGNDAFRIAVNDDIYVDKTGMIALLNQRINKNKRYVCVSRPRRFGKSMAADMLPECRRWYISPVRKTW